MAQTLLNTMSRDQQEWENQIGYERFVHDCVSREKYAYIKGEQQGLQQGLSQGEHKHAIETAQRLLQMGLSIEQVAQGVGLSIDEIRAL